MEKRAIQDRPLRLVIMNKFLIENLPLAITVFSTAAGVIGFFVARVRHSYGLERDINHLKRDYKSLSNHTNILLKELERRLDSVEKDIATVRGINQVFLAQSKGF